jgi:hypothetical protein
VSAGATLHHIWLAPTGQKKRKEKEKEKEMLGSGEVGTGCVQRQEEKEVCHQEREVHK